RWRCVRLSPRHGRPREPQRAALRGRGNDFSEWRSSSQSQGLFDQTKSERLIRLRPCKGCVSIRNISPLFQKVKFGTLACGCDLGKRAIEVVDLLAQTRGVGWVCKEPLAINDGEDRVEDAPLRLAIGL